MCLVGLKALFPPKKICFNKNMHAFKFLFVFLTALLICASGANAGVGGNVLRGGEAATRVRAPAAVRSGVRALIKQQHVKPITSAPVMRSIFNAARNKFRGVKPKERVGNGFKKNRPSNGRHTNVSRAGYGVEASREASVSTASVNVPKQSGGEARLKPAPAEQHPKYQRAKRPDVSSREFERRNVLLERTRHSVVQISVPNHSEVLGTGFIVESRGKLWVAMPFHLGGASGQSRVVRLLKRDGTVAEKEVTIATNGTAGWHEPDISLAELPAEWYKQVDPLKIAPVDKSQKVYSLGYVAGEFGMEDNVVVIGEFTHVDGQSMLRKFHIPGSTMETPISGNGYCGSALLQEINGEWKVVGMHNGHVLDLENPAASVGSSVNLVGTIDRLVDNYMQPMSMENGLEFRGWEITRLGAQERVEAITVIRANGVVEPVRYMRNFAGPYSDAHVEWAVEDMNLQSGDRLIFSIKGRDEMQNRVNIEKEFVIP